MRLAIIVVHYAAPQKTIACVQACMHLDGFMGDIVVVDNSQTEWDLCEAAIAGAVVQRQEHGTLLPDVTAVSCTIFGVGQSLSHIRATRNLGFAGGCNRGLMALMADDPDPNLLFWFINSDAVPMSDAYLRIRESIDRAPAPGIWGTTICDEDAPNRVQSCGGMFSRPLARPSHHLEGARYETLVDSAVTFADYPVGASMIASRAFVQQYGYLPEDLFLYFEEMMWLARAGITSRIPILCAPRVLHEGGASTGLGTSTRPRYLSYYLSRNVILVGKVLGPPWSIWFVIIESTKAVRLGTRQGLGHLMASLWGICDGVRGVSGFSERYAPHRAETS